VAGAEKKPVVNQHRVRLMSEAMRPADTAEKWRKLESGVISDLALEGFTRIDCDTPSRKRT